MSKERDAGEPSYRRSSVTPIEKHCIPSKASTLGEFLENKYSPPALERAEDTFKNILAKVFQTPAKSFLLGVELNEK